MKSPAFTLIELIVTIGIIAMLTGMGVVAYNQFNKRERLNQAVRTVKSHLRRAQTDAVANKIPDTCLNFLGYQASFTTNSYVIGALCGVSVLNVQTYNLPADMLISDSPIIVLFKPRIGGTDLADDLVLNFTYGSNQGSLTVTTIGEIK